MRTVLFLIIHVLVVFESHSQKVILPISFIPVFGNYTLNVNDTATQSPPNSVEILKFYISKIQLHKNDSLVFEERLSYHLIDISNNESLKLKIPISESLKYNSIKFYIGVDSITNVSGVMGGDLDPTKGMYWTWQSGYINFKLEGKSTLCKTRDKRFQFHLGGYQAPFSALQSIQLNAINNQPIAIKLDIEKFITSIDFENANSVMLPSAYAVKLSQYLANCFFINDEK